MENKNIESILIFNVRESLFNNSITIDIQSFPKYSNKIKSYEMVFDMKFREDYVSDSNICIGPLWEEFGSGEFSIQLLKAYDFKNKITGIYDQASQDECKNYLHNSDKTNWPQKVKNIKLKLKAETYLSDMLKKARTNTNSVSKKKTKYRKLKVKFNN